MTSLLISLSPPFSPYLPTLPIRLYAVDHQPDPKPVSKPRSTETLMMAGDIPPPSYTEVAGTTSAKKPWVDRLLARLGLCRGVPATQKEKRTSKPPPKAEPCVETEAKGESESEPEPEESNPEAKRVLKLCGRCGRIFYHPIRPSDPNRSCGLHHPGRLPTLPISNSYLDLRRCVLTQLSFLRPRPVAQVGRPGEGEW